MSGEPNWGEGICGERRHTENTPEYISPNATCIALHENIVTEHENAVHTTHPVRVATSIRVWGLYVLDA